MGLEKKMKETLQEIWERLAKDGYKTDKGDVHAYLPIYEELFSPYREKALSILEIGLFNGHSMRLWKEYFTKAEIHGIDCDEEPHGGMADLRPMIAEGWNIHIMDATDKLQVYDKFRGMTFDIIIDDAGHDIMQQIQLYELFIDRVSDGGLYICEDVQNIDETKEIFEKMGGEIIDLRSKKNRYDDILIVFKP